VKDSLNNKENLQRESVSIRKEKKTAYPGFRGEAVEKKKNGKNLEKGAGPPCPGSGGGDAFLCSL